jgi:hypothetical protein
MPCALFAKNTPGWGTLTFPKFSNFGKTDVSSLRPTPSAECAASPSRRGAVALHPLPMKMTNPI